MNDRLTIPGAVPADRAEALSDRSSRYLDDLADKLDAENQKAAEKNAPTYLGQQDFWKALFADEVPEFIDQPLADCMKHLDAACNGELDSVDAILRALHQIERQALPLAQRALKDIYDREGK